MVPNDTPIEIDRMQVAMLRRAGELHRADLASSLTNSCIDRLKRSIVELMPDADESARRVRFIELQYGRDLARAYAAHLKDSAA